MLDLNKFYCGDSRFLLSDLDKESVDLVVTSPPYDNIRDYKGYSFDFEEIARGLYRVIKPGGVVVWVVADQTKDYNESGTSFKQALFFKEIGFNLYDTMIYVKSGCSVPSNEGRYIHSFEYMFVLSKGKPKTTNIIQRKNLNAGSKRGRFRERDGSFTRRDKSEIREFGSEYNVWYYEATFGIITKDLIAHQHPAIFPEALAADHIYSWSNEGDLVLDPFSGSGTTCVMARKMGRNYIGFDISQDYVDNSNKRISSFNTLF